MDDEVLRRLLQGVDFGAHGLTRHELRTLVPGLPETVFLRLPDNKRYYRVEDVLQQTGWRAVARADGEFVESGESVPSSGATGDGGPPAWGQSPLISTHPVQGAADDEPITGESHPRP